MGYADKLLEQPKIDEPAAATGGKYSGAILQVPAPTPTTAVSDSTPSGRMAGQDALQAREQSGPGFATNFKASVAQDPQTRLRLLAEAQFPDDPKAVERFGYQNGKPVYIENGRVVDAQGSGLSSKAGRWASETPEALGALAGSAVTRWPNAGGVVGGVVGDVFKNVMSQWLLDDPKTAQDYALSAGEEAVTGGLGAGLARTGGALYNRRAVQNAEKFDRPAALDVQRRIKDRTGIDLDFAQAGNIRQLRDLKKWAAKYPSQAADVIEALDIKQLDQAANAVQRKVLDVLSSESDPAALAATSVNAAKAAIQAAKMKRHVDTRPLFQPIEREQLSDEVAQSLLETETAKSALKSILGDSIYADELAGMGVDKELRENTVKAWDLVRRNLRDRATEATTKGKGNRARLLNRQADRVEEILEDSIPAYREAMTEWRRLSQELVNPLENGSIGLLAKIEGPKMAQTAARVIDGTLQNPGAVAAVKRKIIETSGVQAWRDTLKLSLTNAVNKASREAQGGEVVNFPGKLRQALYGTPSQKQAMRAAIGETGVTAFEDIMDAFQMLAKDIRGRSGSDTAFNQAISQQQRGGTITAAARTVMAPLTSIREVMDEKMIAANADALADALTDPRKLARLKELRKLKPGQQRAAAILGVVGVGQSLEEVGEAALAPRPDGLPYATPSANGSQ